MALEDSLKVLDAQYQAVIAKRDRDERLYPFDLPRIGNAPVISEDERREIYDKQGGFEFQGMPSNKLSTILGSFNGTSVWVPHNCKEFMSFEKFEKKLDGAYNNSSSGYDALLIIVNNLDETCLDGCVVKRSELLNHAEFPWSCMSMVYEWGEQDITKVYADAYIIRPKLTIIDVPKIETFDEARTRDVINKLWLYMAWTKRDKD